MMRYRKAGGMRERERRSRGREEEKGGEGRRGLKGGKEGGMRDMGSVQSKKGTDVR